MLMRNLDQWQKPASERCWWGMLTDGKCKDRKTVDDEKYWCCWWVSGRGVAGRGGALRQDTAGQHGQAPHTPAHHRRRNAWMERPQALAWYHFRCIYLKWLVPAPSQASSPRGWAPPGTQRAGSCCRRIGRGTCGRVAAPQPLARRGSLGSLVYTLFK